jgi:hypothetical protein
MKLVTWNAAMRFRDKIEEIFPYMADIIVIPLIVTGEGDFILLTVWSQNTKKQYDSYIGQIYLALKYYESLLKKPCVIIGGWNSNKIFDHIKRVGTHTEVVDFLKSEGIRSAFHTYFNEKHGQETILAHFFRKEKSSLFHNDFLFASESILTSLRHFEIGSYDRWITFSDHAPLCAVFDNE